MQPPQSDQIFNPCAFCWSNLCVGNSFEDSAAYPGAHPSLGPLDSTIPTVQHRVAEGTCTKQCRALFPKNTPCSTNIDFKGCKFEFYECHQCECYLQLAKVSSAEPATGNHERDIQQRSPNENEWLSTRPVQDAPARR